MEPREVVESLMPVCGGHAAEIVGSLMDPDLDGFYTPGVMAQAAMALKEVSGFLEGLAKDSARPQLINGMLVDGGIEFKDRPASIRVGVDSAAVKAAYPPDERPEFYKRSEVAGGIAMKRLPGGRG